MSDHADSLCNRAESGDLSAASELVSLFYERIFAYFRRVCGNDQDAADLTQKTFFKVWTSLGSFRRRSAFSTWLHGIAHHVYVDCRPVGAPPVHINVMGDAMQPGRKSGPISGGRSARTMGPV